MVAHVHAITVDCENSYQQSLFWSQVTGWSEDPNDPNEPEHPENFISPAGSDFGMLFINVPEGKQVKNRIHLDLWSKDGTREQEVDRVIELGATLADDRRNDDGTGFVVLTDPEGNEFCICRAPHER